MTDVAAALAELIHARRIEPADTTTTPSYTRQLLDAGPDRCARKFGEEAIELVVASLAGATKIDGGNHIRMPLSKVEKDAVVSEAADVLYHLLVLLESRDVPWDDVTAKLASRMGTSGIAEKAARRTG
ncbi:MAG: phosphoribosyl-ATP diphosphatase [Verrucomicrobiae bacterium]|nr:phosphoribosyl-ATP diphosphatase [Verrucomicrobiae bacterium]